MNHSTPVEMYGKDHWSMLAYVESCCVEGQGGIGTLNGSRMRCNQSRHPLHAGHLSDIAGWKLSYSTRLAGFFDFPERNVPEAAISEGLQLRDHDDWDCLDDLAEAGFVEILSLANAQVKMTEQGMAVVARLRAHKAAGGMFANFAPREPAHVA